MITPTRLGLKYAPVPTLALEYEDDLSGVEDAGDTSLFVLREGDGEASRRRVKKLHVVELPLLTGASETRRIVEQLQRDNSRFLSPSVVNESQLTRLLDLLVEHLRAVGSASEPTELGDGAPITKTESVSHAPAPVMRIDHEEENDDEHDEVDESFIEDSVAESSQALESSVTPSDHEHVDRPVDLPLAVPALTTNRGTFLSQEDNESEDERHEASGEESVDRSKADMLPARGGQDEGDDDDEQLNSSGKAAIQSNTQTSATAAADDMENRKDEEDEEEKKRVLKSGSEMSEEDIQSEELEYFSEDESDEDSF
jgi:hypothetical protein